MQYQSMANEMKSLEEITNKNMSQLVNYYHKCYQQIKRPVEYSTEFEFNEVESRINNIILSFIRDYALFDDDNAKLLCDFTADDDDLFNCCSPYRMG